MKVRPQPFGDMPADRELTAFGLSFSGLILGIVVADFVSGSSRAASALGWLSVLFGVLFGYAASQVQGWTLRAALVGFALAQLLGSPAAIRVGLDGRSPELLHGLSACLLIVASWPYSTRRSRVAALVLFAAAAGFKYWLLQRNASVFSSRA